VEKPALTGLAKKVGMAVGVVSLVAVAAAAWTPGTQAFSKLHGVEQKEERMQIVPSYPACSAPKENCLATGCCKTSGHTCFLKTQSMGMCNETCTPGTQGFTLCDIVSPASVPVQRELPNSLYCFAVYTKDTGSPKKSTELELLQAQRKYGASLFGCEAWDVFSDIAVNVGSDYTTVQVTDELNEFHVLKRKSSGTWVNWGMFYQVWVSVRGLGKWQDKGWTVKVDADAVFIPGRLRDWLSTKKDTPHGVYFENCKNVQYGFFGNLEVMSNTATSVLTSYLEDCHAQFAPCAFDGCDWKYGPWGEDVFVQRCMDHHYVDKVEAFDLTTDGACAADRPADEKKNKDWRAPDCSKVTTVTAHPFKKPKDYFKCLGEIMQTTYSA